MRAKPDGYEALQKVWSTSFNLASEVSARGRVTRALGQVESHGLAIGRVLVIGPRHGIELEQFQDSGVKEILAVDVVPEFCVDCRNRGFTCLEGEAEHLDGLVKGKWNVYTSHALEHTYDIERAVAAIGSVCLDWCAVAVPLKPGTEEPGDGAHFSPIRSEKMLTDMFDKWGTRKELSLNGTDLRVFYVPNGQA